MGSLSLFRFPCHSKLYPFLSTGKSMFTAFQKERSTTLSELIFVCNFTCLITRALHLEICEDLFVESLKLAVQNFVSRQDYPDVSDSDDGKHLVVANQVITLSFQRNFISEKEYMWPQRLQKSSQWTFIAPQANAVWRSLGTTRPLGKSKPAWCLGNSSKDARWHESLTLLTKKVEPCWLWYQRSGSMQPATAIDNSNFFVDRIWHQFLFSAEKTAKSYYPQVDDKTNEKKIVGQNWL